MTITEIAQRIKADQPGLTTGSYVYGHTRDVLRDLAAECGMDAAARTRATDADLISIYRVALKDANAAIRTAGKIAHRINMHYGLEAAPVTATAGADMEAINTAISDALGRAQSQFEGKLADALAGNDDKLTAHAAMTQIAILDAVRADIAASAHQAAAEALKALTPTRLEVSVNAAPVTDLGLVHRDTEKVIQYLAAKTNVYLHGPAGSGKTTVAQKCAEAFGLQFYMAAKVESEYLLLGFRDARGEVVRTPFRDAFEYGGVFLFDEMDRSGASALTAINAALANGFCAFPDALVHMHPDFKCIGAGNTKLTGATHEYTGASRMDASVINRFAFIEFGYDEEMERALAGDAAWVAHVQKIRAYCVERELPLLVTPRATIDGCKLLGIGRPWAEVEDAAIFKGFDAATVAQIREGIQ